MEQPLRPPRSLALRVRDRIAGLVGETGLRPGDKLPTEAQLTERFGISRPALREALKLLEQEGLIRVEHGRGRFVSAMTAARVDRPITVFESVTDMTAHCGYRLVNRVLDVSEVPAEAEVAERLGLAQGEPVIRLERLRLDGGTPLLYCVDHVPRALLPGGLGEVDWTGSLLQVLDGAGRRPVMSAASVQAVPLPAEVSARHGLGAFGPALLIVETCFDAAGAPVIYAAYYHSGSHFSFSLVRR